MTPLREMRNEAQCFAMAEDMLARAGGCGSAGQSADFLDMARCWRVVAAQAAWQDACGATPLALA